MRGSYPLGRIRFMIRLGIEPIFGGKAQGNLRKCAAEICNPEIKETL